MRLEAPTITPDDWAVFTETFVSSSILFLWKVLKRISMRSSATIFWVDACYRWLNSYRNGVQRWQPLKILAYFLQSCPLFGDNQIILILLCKLRIYSGHFLSVCVSSVAQRKRAGPITQRSVDRNHSLLHILRKNVVAVQVRLESADFKKSS